MLCPKCLQVQGDAEVCVSCGATLPKLAADLLIGKAVGRYNIVRCLGRGGFGAVYEASHVETSARVALKVLRRELLDDPTAVERFLREAQAAALIDHPRALKIFDKGTTEDGLLFFAMELLSGETLEAHLQRVKHIPERELLSLMRPLLEILSEAHQKGVIHRDIKPPNIMLTASKDGVLSPTLLDFGLSGLRGASPLTSASAVSGTPSYMAPEQWEGLAKADARSDLYSLAVVAYQALSGRLPFEADSPLAWLNKHRSEAPLDLRQAMAGRPVSEPVYQAIMRALAKSPAERFASAHEFLASLSGPPQGRSTPKRSLGRSLASVVLVGLVGGGLYWREPLQALYRQYTAPSAHMPTSSTSSTASAPTTKSAAPKTMEVKAPESSPASLASTPNPTQETWGGDVLLWASAPGAKEPTEEELLQKIEKERARREFGEMCALINEYLVRWPNGAHVKKLRESAKGIDLDEFPECYLLE